MGLDNSTRTSGLIYAINNLVNAGNDLGSEYKKMKSLVDELWPCFIGKVNNSGAWIFGSSSQNAVEEYTIDGIWSCLIHNGIEDGIENDVDEYKFDPMSMLRIQDFMNCSESKIVDIFQLTEHAIYYLRRYDDEYLHGLEKLSNQIAKIQGECFNLLKNTDIHKAYLGFHICKMIYGNIYDKNNWVAQYLIDEHMHHYLKHLDSFSTSELCSMHKELVEHDDEMVRLSNAVKMAGRSFYYDHQHKKLLKLLGDKGRNESEIETIRGLCEKCKEEHKQYVKKFEENYSEQHKQATWS